MGARDIMPLATGQNGVRIQAFPITANTSANTAATSWREGEVVELVSNAIIVTPDGAADPHTGLVYIAAASSEGLLRAKTFGTTVGDLDNELVPCYAFTPGVEFVTRNVVNGDDTNIGPAGSGAMTNVVVGATADLWRDNTNPGTVSGDVNGDFSIDIAGNGFIITQILDSRGDDTAVSGNTADKVVFTLIVA